ncbi:MAG: hypothetical protein MK184_11480, partial [Acidimicrobiales bacterium]|nr:hypothetical protein [Acidimicrobiales bacterium]
MNAADSLQRLLGLPAGVQVVWLGHMTCPRCGTPLSMREPVDTNALSRCSRGERDLPLWVCSPCGVDEGLREYAGNLNPPSSWAHPPATTVEVHPVTD